VLRPHLLYIAFFYPPSRSSGVYRALATTRAFVNAGWDVTVVTTTERFFEEEIGSVDRSLLQAIPAGVNVERVQFSFRTDEAAIDLREVGWLRGNFPILHRGLRRRFRSAVTAVDILRGRSPLSFSMDDRYLSWIEPVVGAANRIWADRPFRHVLVTGNPYSAFEAARVISTLHGVPFTIDYRDPWAFDMRTSSLARLSAPTFAAERRIVEESHACIQVNDAISDAYMQLYPEHAYKQHIVVNGYDQESIPDIKPPATGPLTFGILGTVTDLWPLAPLFEAWHGARPGLPDGSHIKLGGHLGYFQWSAEPLLSTFPGEEAGFEYVGPVPKSEVAEFYAGIDVALVPLFGGPMVTAGKVLEVAALGIPILCIQEADGGARRFLDRHHPLAVGVDPCTETIVEGIRMVARMATSISVLERERVRASMAKYERQKAMEELVSIVADANSDPLPG